MACPLACSIWRESIQSRRCNIPKLPSAQGISCIGPSANVSRQHAALQDSRMSAGRQTLSTSLNVECLAKEQIQQVDTEIKVMLDPERIIRILVEGLCFTSVAGLRWY